MTSLNKVAIAIKAAPTNTVLIAKGYGETRALASNDTEEGKFRNRRIEFTVR
jgi:outer membrane protein OmpA-like peptidoglycan-associated protein